MAIGLDRLLSYLQIKRKLNRIIVNLKSLQKRPAIDMVNIPAVLLLTGLTLVSSVQLKSDFKMSEEDYYRMSALRPLAVEFAEYFANISEIDFQSNTSQLAGPADLQCLAEMDHLMKGFAARNMWALKSKYYTD